MDLLALTVQLRHFMGMMDTGEIVTFAYRLC